MGKIKKLLENELVGGTQSTDVYPITSTKAIYDENNERLDNILEDLWDKIGIFKNAGYLYVDAATPTTDPGTPKAKVFYIANGKGTYDNFGGIEVTEDEVVFLYWDSSWHKVSTGIASQMKLTELKEKVDALALGAFYGYFPDSSSLPGDVTTPGYAYVGLDNPYKIWNFNGESWSDSGTSIDMNDADEEDITRNADGKLQFKDRFYGDGMGYVILRKDKTFAEQVSQANTIYEIRYDFDLGGKDVKIPNNCTLKFNGGKVSNGVIIGSNSMIKAGVEHIFESISFEGDWLVCESYPEWFGANGLWTSAAELEKISNQIRLTAPIYSNMNATTININKKLVSSVNTTINVSLATGVSVAIQLGAAIDSPLNRVQGVTLDGINLVVGNSNRTETACLGVGNIGKSRICQCFFKNFNYKTSEFTQEQLLNPMSFCNYAIIINGNMDTTSFHNLKTGADVAIYVKAHADFVSVYDADLMGHPFAYAGVYGAAFSQFNFYNVAFAKCGIRGIEMATSGNIYTESVLLEGCRFEQMRYNPDVNLNWRHFKFSIDPQNNTNKCSLTCNGCELGNGTILDVNVTKGAFSMSFNGGGYVQTYVAQNPFIINLGDNAILNIKFNGAHWVAHCPNWTFDNNLQYDGIYYRDYGVDAKMLDLSNAHIYRNYGGNISLLGVPLSASVNNISIKNGSSFFNTAPNIGKPVWWYNGYWVAADGFDATKIRSGTTAERPGVSSTYKGFQYFDTTLNKPIYWTGTKWVDATGADV